MQQPGSVCGQCAIKSGAIGSSRPRQPCAGCRPGRCRATWRAPSGALIAATASAALRAARNSGYISQPRFGWAYWTRPMLLLTSPRYDPAPGCRRRLPYAAKSWSTNRQDRKARATRLPNQRWDQKMSRQSRIA